MGVIRCGQILGVLGKVATTEATANSKQPRSSLSALLHHPSSLKAATSKAQAQAQALTSKCRDSFRSPSRPSGPKPEGAQPRAQKLKSKPQGSLRSSSTVIRKAKARARTQSKSQGSRCAPSHSRSSKAAATRRAQAQAWEEHDYSSSLCAPSPQSSTQTTPDAGVTKKRPAVDVPQAASDEDLMEHNDVIGTVFLGTSGGKYTLTENLKSLAAAIDISRQYWPRHQVTVSTAQGVLDDLDCYKRFLQHLSLKGTQGPYVLPHLLRKRCHVILTPEIQKSPEWQAMPFRSLAILSADVQGAAGHLSPDMTVADVEKAFGVSAHFLTMWACLLGPALDGQVDPQQVMSFCADPKNAWGPDVFMRNSVAAGQSVG